MEFKLCLSSIFQLSIIWIFIIHIYISKLIKIKENNLKVNFIGNRNRTKAKLNKEVKEEHNEKDNFFKMNTRVHQMNCDSQTCFYPYGMCINSTVCLCTPDYADLRSTFTNLTEYPELGHKDKFFCSYRRKKVIIACMLELFLPLGLGHFYVGKYVKAWIKLSYNTFIYTLGIFLHLNEKCKREELYYDIMIVLLFLICITPLWNMIDFILFISGYYKDGFDLDLS
jgi:hypothetical protein